MSLVVGRNEEKYLVAVDMDLSAGHSRWLYLDSISEVEESMKYPRQKQVILVRTSAPSWKIVLESLVHQQSSMARQCGQSLAVKEEECLRLYLKIRIVSMSFPEQNPTI